MLSTTYLHCAAHLHCTSARSLSSKFRVCSWFTQVHYLRFIQLDTCGCVLVQYTSCTSVELMLMLAGGSEDLIPTLFHIL